MNVSNDNYVKLLNLKCRREYSFIGHTDSVVSICGSSDGKYIVSASEDMLVKIWNIKELREGFTVDFDMGL